MISRTNNPKLGHVLILPIESIRPSPENAKLYRPVNPGDPDVKALAKSIRKIGVKEPLVVSADGWLLSGHRRHVAAQLAGLVEVPCRIDPIRRDADPSSFIRLLREFNRQRVKSFDEVVREEVLSASGDDKRASVCRYRRDRAAVNMAPMELREAKARTPISSAKAPMLAAIDRVLKERRDFWPLTVRQIHYALLNDPPRRHASKPRSVYANDLASYKALDELLTRARLAGRITWDAVADETRSVTTWPVHRDPGSFLRKQMDGFLKNYWRDLLQSQPNQLEIVVEKDTIEPIVRPVAMEYTIPLTSGHGFASLSPRLAMADRFKKTGKEKLIVLLLSDFDPDGQEISHSFAASLRDDFGVTNILPVRVALTADLVKRFNLPAKLRAKKKSSNYKRFAEAHGDDVWELEALKPADLQAVLREAIEGVLDREAFTHETEQEARDVAKLDALRRQTKKLLANVKLD